MGARIAVRGEYRIDPPLKLSEIKESGFLSSEDGGGAIRSIVLALTHDERETDEAVTTVITCSRVVPWMASPFDPRGLLEDVEELRAECAGHTVTGQMVLYDAERLGCVSRVVATPEGVREEGGRIVWPDGTEVDPLW
jgi:hypothetical protein